MDSIKELPQGEQNLPKSLEFEVFFSSIVLPGLESLLFFYNFYSEEEISENDDLKRVIAFMEIILHEAFEAFLKARKDRFDFMISKENCPATNQGYSVVITRDDFKKIVVLMCSTCFALHLNSPLQKSDNTESAKNESLSLSGKKNKKALDCFMMLYEILVREEKDVDSVLDGFRHYIYDDVIREVTIESVGTFSTIKDNNSENILMKSPHLILNYG